MRIEWRREVFDQVSSLRQELTSAAETAEDRNQRDLADQKDWAKEKVLRLNNKIDEKILRVKGEIQKYVDGVGDTKSALEGKLRRPFRQR